MTIHASILAWRIPMDRGAWWATVHGVVESDMTERLSTAQHQPILSCIRLTTITTALCQLQPIKPGSDLIFWTVFP